MMPVINLKWRVMLGGVIGIISVILIAKIPPPEGLSSASMLGLGIFVGAIVWWILGVMPDYVTALLMCAAWAGTKIVPYNVAFAQFASENYWLLMSALGIGLAVTKSGLLNRVSLLILDKFPCSYRGQTAALMISGCIVAPLIPSVTSKAAIAAPLAKGISDKMRFDSYSKGASGIFSAMLIGFAITGPSFLSSSFMCYTIKGLLPRTVQDQLTWTTWFVNALPWTICVLVLSYFAIQLFYKPDNEVKVDHTEIKEQIMNLGPMSKNEKIVMIILLLCLILWVTETLHGIAAATVAIVALCILIGSNTINRSDFQTGIAWDALIFIGCIISIGSVFPTLNIDKWIGSLAGRFLLPVIDNIWLYIIMTALIIYIVRFVLVSMIATFTIFTVFVTPFALKVGINPFVTAFVILTSVNVFTTVYQNSTFLAAYYASGGMVKHGHIIKMSLAYMLINIIALMACVPIWHAFRFLNF